MVLDEILFGLALVLLSLLSGNRLLTTFRPDSISILDEILFSIGIGLGCLSLSVLLLGLSKLLYTSALVFVLIGFCTIAPTNYQYALRLWTRAKHSHVTFSRSEVLIILLTLLFAIITLANALTPPVARDALIHHLAIPKIYITHHAIVEVPFSAPSYYPPLVEMLYAAALLLSSDISTKVIHFLFYLGSLCLTFSLGKLCLPRRMSLLAVLLFASLPVVSQVASTAYADLTLTFYSLGAVVATLRWFQSNNARWLYLAACMVAFAVGSKYNGLLVLFSLLTIVTGFLIRKKTSFLSLAKTLTFLVLSVILINSVWLGRNYAFTGNPLFPLASEIIGKSWLPDIPQPSAFQIRNAIYGETLWDQVILPWNLSVKTKSTAGYGLDGVANPFYLILLPFFILFVKKSTEIKAIAYFCLLYLLFFWASSSVRIRYLMPILPMIGIITAYTILHLEIKWKPLLLTILLAATFLLNLYWVLNYTSAIDPLCFLTGNESRRDYLCRQIPQYPVFEYINTCLSENAHIMFLYGGKHGNDAYYLDRAYSYDSRDLGYTCKKILNGTDTPEEVHEAFLLRNIDYFLINWKLLEFDFSASLPRQKLLLFREFRRKFLRLEFSHANCHLYRLL
ncbi:MAG: glycosyltransferase family 39 protein [Deltaproteobacteria bacterium]|nr:glycosyltransferase family 39 protein [Deltaproteobacteria bacterium]